MLVIFSEFFCKKRLLFVRCISCKNMTEKMSLARILQDSCKKGIFCQNLARFVYFVKILQESCKNCIYLQPGKLHEVQNFETESALRSFLQLCNFSYQMVLPYRRILYEMCLTFTVTTCFLRKITEYRQMVHFLIKFLFTPPVCSHSR